MPMYFPDLKSVRVCAKAMSKNTPPKNYKGIVPKNESELEEARKQLATYFRNIWHDEVQALEIELAVTKNDYEEKMQNNIKRIFNL